MCQKTSLHIELLQLRTYPRTPVYFLFMGQTQSPSENPQITAELHVLFLFFLALKNYTRDYIMKYILRFHYLRSCIMILYHCIRLK